MAEFCRIWVIFFVAILRTSTWVKVDGKVDLV